MHHIDCYFLYLFALTLSDAVCLWFSFIGFYFCLSFPTLNIMVRKTRANKKSTSTFTLAFDSDRFRFEKNQEAYEKLNIFRSVWAERNVILDELDPEIRRNFKHRGWFPLLDISLSTPMIQTSSMWWVGDKGWRACHYPSVVAFALKVPFVRQPVYPYSETPLLDNIMSYLTSTSIQWGTDPRITSHKLTEIHYLFSEFLVILSGQTLTCRPFLLRDVHFCMPLWLMLLGVFLLLLFDHWLRFIGVVLQHMVCSSLCLFIGFFYI